MMKSPGSGKRFAVLMLLFIFCCMHVQSQHVAKQIKVIAHRGAWKNTNLSQNSLGALNAALNMGVFASECDIWMTSDSILVVNHDPHFYDMPIESTTYRELLSKKYPNGESIATLQEFLTVIKGQQQTRLVLDIKPSKIDKARSIIVAQKCYDMVTQAKAQTIVDYILFNYDACLALEALDPKANIAYLNGDKSPEQVGKDGLWGIDYSYRALEKNPTWVADAKTRGLTVNVWTVNDRELAESYIKQGVDFITTDEPEMLLERLRRD